MTELTPDPVALVLEDPAMTRVVHRRVGAAEEELLARAAPVTAARVGVVAAVGGTDLAALEAVLAWRPSRLRCEVVVPATSEPKVRTAIREAAAASGRRVSLVDQPVDGRVGALVAVVTTTDHDVVVVVPPPGARAGRALEQVPATLMAMWRDGADAGIIDGDRTPRVDAAQYLVDSLGLSGRPEAAGTVLLRRWVARWILDDVTRASDPAVEVADRVRLLGAGIVSVRSDDTPAGP